MLGRQPRAVLPPTQRARDRAGEEADDDPAEDVHLEHGRFWHVRAAREAPADRQARNDSTAATTLSGWVWWAAWRAPSMTTIRPSASRSSRASVASRKTGRLSPPRSCRTGWRTAPSRSSDAAGSASASSSRRIVPAAAARTRPDRVGAVGREVGGGHPDHLGQEERQRAVAVAGRRAARAGGASMPVGW